MKYKLKLENSLFLAPFRLMRRPRVALPLEVTHAQTLAPVGWSVGSDAQTHRRTLCVSHDDADNTLIQWLPLPAKGSPSENKSEHTN